MNVYRYPGTIVSGYSIVYCTRYRTQTTVILGSSPQIITKKVSSVLVPGYTCKVEFTVESGYFVKPVHTHHYRKDQQFRSETCNRTMLHARVTHT